MNTNYVFFLTEVDIQPVNKLKCCVFKGKQASEIESTSLCCINYSVLHVIDIKE